MTKISGWPGSDRSGPTLTRPARSWSAPSQRAAARRHDAGGPDDGGGCQTLVADGNAVSVALGNRRAEPHLDTQPLERAARRFAQRLRKGRQQPRARLDQHDARVAGIDVAEVVTQRHMRQLGDGARHLHAGRAAADHHEGEEALPLFGRRRRFGVLEGRQDAAADAGGVVDVLQAGRHALPVVVAEIGVPCAGRDDEIVVRRPRDRRPSRSAAACRPLRRCP